MKRLSIVVLISLSIMYTGINAFAAEMMYMIDFTVAWPGDTEDSQVNMHDSMRLTLYGDTDNIKEIVIEPGLMQYELVCTSGKLEKNGFFSWELERDWKVLETSDSVSPFSGLDGFQLLQLGEGGEGDGTGFVAAFTSTVDFTLFDSFNAELNVEYPWPLAGGLIRTTGEDVDLTDAWTNYYSQQLANPPTEDSDGDGIYDNVDEDPLAYSTRFSDTPLGGVTSGNILYMDAGITVEIMDASDPNNGVKAVVSGPAGGIARISIDDSTGIYNLSPGEYNLTTGSVFLQCLTGNAKVEFTIEGTPILVQIGEGTVVFEETIVDGELKTLNLNVVQGEVTVNNVPVPPGEQVSHSDGDGIPDEEDTCPTSDLSPTVVIDGCDSGVENHLLEDGCTISDRVMAYAYDARNHGKFVSCVAKITNNLKKAGIISGHEKGAIQSCASQANIP